MNKIIAFDTETHGLDWYDGETAFLATWADAESEYVADLSVPDERSTFLEALNEADTLVCHNLAFDVHQVRETCAWDALLQGKELHDTDLLARVVNPLGAAGGYGAYKLKSLAKLLLDDTAADSEDEMKELAKKAGIKLKNAGGYYDFYRAFPDKLVRYALNDARITYDLFIKLYSMLDDRTRKCYELEMATAPVLIRAEQRGIKVDQDELEPIYKEYVKKERELREEVTKHIPEEALTGEGSKALLVESLQMQGVPLYRKTDSGQLKTDKFALQEFEDDFPFLADFMEWRRVDKFISTYLSPMRGRDTVHTSFRQAEAWTGRMSSARPNMQNLPKRAGKEVRKPLVARPGHSLAVADYDGIEARLLAYYMNDANYRQMFIDGLDPHAWMAAQIHGGTMEDFAKDGPNDALRSAAKNTLFAITYGAGAPRVADMNQISKDEARALISQIKNSLPKYRKLMGRIRKKVATQGHVTTLFGRRQIINKDKSYVGLNALIQGTAADIMKEGLVRVAEAVEPYGALPLLVVHDEVVVETPDEHAETVLDITCKVMAECIDITPPLEVSGSIVKSYADA